MKAKKLRSEFGPRAVEHSGELLLLKPADALDLITRATEEGVPIVGLHAFAMDAPGTQPRLEQAIDYADAVTDGHGCWHDAEDFIRQRAALGLVFEVLLGSDPIEAV